MQEINIYCALSGGGFRATFFHAGVIRAIIRLGLKDNIKLISSVSGGSILNGLLALEFDNINTIEDYDNRIIIPLTNASNENIRNKLLWYKIFKRVPEKIMNLVMFGLGRSLFGIDSFKTIDKFAQLLDRLYGNCSLSDFSNNYRAVINCSNLNSGARWRFDNIDFGDYKTGYSYEIDQIRVADAVAASAAFPLVFTPLRLQIEQYRFYLRNREKKDKVPNTNIPQYVYLTDGGVYDNLGVMAIDRELERNPNGFIIISDAANRFEENVNAYSHLKSIPRIASILLEQISNRERMRIVDKLLSDQWSGVYFKLERSCRYYRDIEDPKSVNSSMVPLIGWPEDIVNLLGKMRTDLDGFAPEEIYSLIHHGESLLETNLCKWHNEIYEQCVNKNGSGIFGKADFNLEDIKKVLNKASKLLFRN